MELVKKHWKFLAALAVLFIFLGLYYLFDISPAANAESACLVVEAAREEIRDIGDFSGSTVMEQQFAGERDELAGVSLMFRKIEKVSDNVKIHVKLLEEESGELAAQWDITGKEVGDYQYHEFVLEEPLKSAAGKHFLLQVVSEDMGVFSPAVTNYNGYESGDMKIQGSTEETSDMVFILWTRNVFIKPLFLVSALIIMAGAVLLGILVIRGNRRMELYFILLGTVWGLLFCIIFPPNTAPDEHWHIATAYANADRMLFRSTVDEDGNTLVRKTDAEIENYKKLDLKSVGYYYEQLRGDNSQEIVSFDKEPMEIPFTAHFVQSVGVAAGWLLHCNGMVTLYLGKLAALLFYLLCGYFTIKWVPWGKLAVMIICLFPMNLELASSFSYDCTVNALCAMIVAYTLKLIYEKPQVTWKDYAFLTALSAIMAPCKVVYIMVCALVFLIPERKSPKPVQARVGKLCTFFSGLVILAVTRIDVLQKLVATQEVSVADTVEHGYTLMELVSHPRSSMGMLFNTILVKIDFYIETMVGQVLGWLDVGISRAVIWAFLGLLFLAVISEDGYGEKMSAKARGWIAVLALVMTGGVVLSMWLDFTLEGSKYISGVQGRYFLTFLPMVVLAFRNRLFRISKNIEGGILAGLFCLELLTVVDVWIVMIG